MRYVDTPSPIMFDDGFLTYWEYVPVTSDSDPVAFEYDGLSWTFSQEMTYPVVGPMPCPPEPGVVCPD
jgi:hypothetical protein